MRKPRRAWIEEDDATMIAMREVDGLRWADIDAHFKRASGSCYARYERLRPPEVRADKIDKKALAVSQRDRRRLLAHTTITAAVFGDPLPGRSALDRMRAACAN